MRKLKRILLLCIIAMIIINMSGCRKIDSQITAISNNNGNGEFVSLVTLKKDDPAVSFYTDRYEYKDEVVKYDDIETIFFSSSSVIMTFNVEGKYGSAEVSATGNSGEFEFITGDNEKHKLKASAFTFFNELKLARQQLYFSDLFNAVYTNIVKSMVNRALQQIVNNGETITIAGLSINKNSATPNEKAIEKGAVQSIDASNYFSVKYIGKYLFIVDKDNKELYSVEYNEKANIILLPMILYELYATQSQAAAVDHSTSAHEFNGHYYQIWHLESGEKVTWEEAEQYAKNDGGNLLKIGNIVDEQGINIEAQWIYNTFCDYTAEFFMGNKSKFLGDESGIKWDIPIDNEKLEWWVVEYYY